MKARVNSFTRKQADKHYSTVNRKEMVSSSTQIHTLLHTYECEETIQTHRLKLGNLSYITECTVLSIFSRDVRSNTGHLSHCGHPAGNNVPLL